MTTTVFVNGTTLSDADWFNDANRVIYDILGDPATAAAARTNLGVGPTLGTEQATTSGTAIDFTSIPAGVKRITITLVGVSTNGTSGIFVQLGDAGGVEATGYLSAAFSVDVSGITAGGASAQTIGVNIVQSAEAAAALWRGTVTLMLEDASDFTWSITSLMARSDAPLVAVSVGTKALSAELDRVRLAAGGADAFDAGVMNIAYER